MKKDMTAAAALLICGLCSLIPVQATICPSPETIIPCYCYVHRVTQLAALVCWGSDVNLVTEEAIERAIWETRLANRLNGTDDWIDLHEFRIMETLLTTFDLTSFIRTRLYYLEFWMNLHVTSIAGPPLPENGGLIDLDSLHIHFSDRLGQFTDNHFQNLLKYFSPRLTWMTIEGTWLTGSTYPINDGSGDIEFLPGLAALSNLNSLSLGRNNITRLEGGQFKRNEKLVELSVTNNEAIEIGEDAFLFGGPDGPNQRLSLYLTYTNLDQSKIHPNSGIDRNSRPIFWRLYSDQLTSLPVQKFQSFLDAHPDNKLHVYDNHIVCNSEVKWLKDRVTEYESKVLQADCENDPGQTVFSSLLVDMEKKK